MTRAIVSCLIFAAAAVAVVGQMPKYGITVTAEKGVDFSKFKTYSWTKGQPSPIKTIDAQITAAVDRELGALGMMTAASGTADVQVTYYSLSRTDVNLDAKADDKGLRPQYPVGSLMVALLQPRTGKRLLRMRVDKPIDTEPAKLEAAINSAVTEMFEKYPTRQAK